MGSVGDVNGHGSRRRANTACIDPYAMGDSKERLHGMVWGPVWGGRGAGEPIDGVAMVCNGLCCGYATPQPSDFWFPPLSYECAI